jgi:myosin-crossreactive antigen
VAFSHRFGREKITVSWQSCFSFNHQQSRFGIRRVSKPKVHGISILALLKSYQKR